MRKGGRAISLAVIFVLVAAAFLTVYRPMLFKNAENYLTPTPPSPEQVQQQVPSPRRAGLPADFVNLKDYVPELEIDLVYYTENNFTGVRLYDDPAAYMRKGTADKLRKVAAEAGKRGYRLKIWDAYRPPAVQFEMWELFPDRRYLADPHKGFSDHAKGCAVDLTLVDTAGKELDMPSGFDEFNAKANRDYSDVSPVQAANARYLEEVMVKQGFMSIWTEWWHFVDADEKNYGVHGDTELAGNEVMPVPEERSVVVP